MSTITTRSSKGSALTHAELDANFDKVAQAKVGTYTVLVSDNRDTIECSGTFTISVPDVATVLAASDTGDFEVTIKNTGAGVITVGRITGADTIDGTAANITLIANESVLLKANQAGNGYNISNPNLFKVGVDSTVAEINASTDGSTSATATTVAAGDRVVYNDAGTMKQVDVDDIDAYFSQTTKTLTNKTLTTPAITNPTGLDSNDVGLGNVDNTSDATKNAASVALTNKTISAAAYTGIQTGFAGSVSGNATTATTLQTARTLNGTSFNGSANITVPTNNASINPTDTTMYPMLSPDNTTGNKSLSTDGGLVYNASTNTLTTTTFSGALSGNVTGNCTGSSGSTTGNAATVTTNANLTGSITSVGNATTITNDAVTFDKINDVVATQRSGSVASGALVPFADGYGWYIVQNGAVTSGTPEYLSNGTWFTGAVNIGANEAIMFLYTANSRIKNYVGGSVTYYWQKVLG